LKSTLREQYPIPESLDRKTDPDLPELSEVEVVRHFIRLSQMNFGVDSGFYPLGSCTMKYNPKINDAVAALDEVHWIHPYQPENTLQGMLEIMHKLASWLAEITGMSKFSLQPAAGANGEFTGTLMIRAYHEINGELEQRREIIIPDSAHGTNPASASMAGFDVVIVPTGEDGCVDIDALKGFDIVHLNLHKTFSTPHGGGGPGAGPVGVKKHLEDFLPVPLVEFDGERYYLNYDVPHTIGKIRSFYGNFEVLVRAFTYILSMGAKGLEKAAEMSVLNANYLASKLSRIRGFEIPYGKDRPVKHEFVLSCSRLKSETGVSAKDIAKRMLDYGVHAPTIYFPPIVKEALMIEPTETESIEEMDRFIEILTSISKEAYEDPEKVLEAPHNTSVNLIDEVKASHPRTLCLSWRMYKKRFKKTH